MDSSPFGSRMRELLGQPTLLTSILMGGVLTGLLLRFLKTEGRMNTQDLVSVIAASVLGGQTYQSRLLHAAQQNSQEGVEKVVADAVSVARSVVLATGSAELAALDDRRRELERQILESKAKLEEIAATLDETVGAIRGRKPAAPRPPIFSKDLFAGGIGGQGPPASALGAGGSAGDSLSSKDVVSGGTVGLAHPPSAP